MVMSFLCHRYMSIQANGVIHEEKWVGVGDNGMGQVVPYTL